MDKVFSCARLSNIIINFNNSKFLTTMKKIVLFLFLTFCIVHTVQAQSGFQQLYGGHNEEIGVNAIASGGGIYFFGATTSSGAGQADMSLVKVDFTGQVLWAK